MTQRWLCDAPHYALPTGFEPAISSVTGKRVNRYSTGALLYCISTPVYLVEY